MLNLRNGLVALVGAVFLLGFGSLPPNPQVTSNLDPYNQTAAISGGGPPPTAYTYTANGTADTLKSDTTDLPYYTLYRAIYVGTGGDLTIHDWDGNSTLFKAVPTGTTINVRPMRIMSTGTTATNIVLLR